MAGFLDIAVSNGLVAGLLAIVAASFGLWGRRPALTHALWVLVWLKLITPPLWTYHVPWLDASRAAPAEPVAKANLPGDAEPIGLRPAREAPQEEDKQEPIAPQAPRNPVLPMLQREDGDEIPVQPEPVRQPEKEPPVEVAQPPIVAANGGRVGWPWIDGVAFVWLAGGGAWLLLALGRLWRFHRLLRFAEPAPAFVQASAQTLAEAMHVRCPDVCVVPGHLSPLLWTLGRRPRLILPAGLVELLSPEQMATLLAHELAHWRRRDDRVRWLELIVLALYWWCPLAWWARRELHQAEEECCDAWVVSLLPDSAKDYALALVETVDFLSAAPADLPVLASGVGRVRLLKRRLKMILQGRTPRALTLTGTLGIAVIGLLMLPLVFSTAQSQGPPAAQPGQKGNPKVELEELRAHIQQLQAEIERIRAEAEVRQQALQRAAQRLQQLQGPAPGNLPPGPRPAEREPGKKAPMGGAGGGPGFPGGGAGGPPGLPGAAPGQPGGPGGPPGKGGNFPGGPGAVPGMPPGGGWGQGFGGGPTEKRLAEVERKLDMILNELREMRKQGPPPMQRPGARPPAGPNNPLQPNPVPPPPPGVAPPPLNAPIGPGTPRPPLRDNQD